MSEPDRLERDMANLELCQADGRPPELLFQKLPRGEHAVGLLRMRFSSGARARGAGISHWIMLHLGQPAPLHCRVGGQQLKHTARAGNVTVCPAQLEFSALGDMRSEALLMAVPVEPLALLTGERSLPRASLRGQLSGFDRALCEIARDLLVEANSGSAHGELHDALFEHLVNRYVAPAVSDARGALSANALARIHRYAQARLGEPIKVDVLADLTGQSRSNFPRVFRRTTGLSPYQYLIRLRLKHAKRLIQLGEGSVAEIAAATGFVDQSHLSNWIRRVYGTPPSGLAAR